MKQEEKYYGLIVKVNNHEPINFSDDSNSDDSIIKEMDTSNHRTTPLEPIMETKVDDVIDELEGGVIN